MSLLLLNWPFCGFSTQPLPNTGYSRTCTSTKNRVWRGKTPSKTETRRAAAHIPGPRLPTQPFSTPHAVAGDAVPTLIVAGGHRLLPQFPAPHRLSAAKLPDLVQLRRNDRKPHSCTFPQSRPSFPRARVLEHPWPTYLSSRTQHDVPWQRHRDRREKLLDVADRFKHASPADKWFEAVKADPILAQQTTTWAGFSAVFQDRFKGAAPASKPPVQLEAELARMRINLAQLSKGTVRVNNNDIYVLVDFVERVREAVAEAAADQRNVGMWDFYVALPPTKIDIATAQFRVQKNMADQMEELQKKLSGMNVAAARITPAAPRVAPTAASTTKAPSPTPATPADQNAARSNARTAATQAQKAQLLVVLRECIRRTHPDTPAGRALHAADLATWDGKFGLVPRGTLQLERGVLTLWGRDVAAAPEVARWVRVALPFFETALRARGGSWLGRVELGAPATARVHVVEVVELKPWYENAKPDAAGDETPEELIDLYTVGSCANEDTSKPFLHCVIAEGLQGEKIRAMALFNTGALVAAMNQALFDRAKRRLGKIYPPTKRLRMAGGSIVSSTAHWEGTLEVDGLRAQGGFEVFDSHGGWSLLFSKPLQAAFGVVHDVAADIVTLNVDGRSAVIQNQHPDAVAKRRVDAAEAARREASTGMKSCAIPPARRVHSLSGSESTHVRSRSDDTQSTHPTPFADGLKDRVGNAAIHAASTGVTSCAIPPARGVPLSSTSENAYAYAPSGVQCNTEEDQQDQQDQQDG
ncbi:hypothetical protein B0H17DRAFT_1219467 [Mycena rosella]|uniref:Uncharacterized protein n=1 Tax=Mycena rosella TaxID=1033263 RepID=A0AAD7BGT1_MYCRO|nr:hypothetical protein B0H17DRAFT_1219467 [Mycena rosella]